MSNAIENFDNTGEAPAIWEIDAEEDPRIARAEFARDDFDGEAADREADRAAFAYCGRN